jgi:hypothetical protein
MMGGLYMAMAMASPVLTGAAIDDLQWMRCIKNKRRKIEDCIKIESG